MVAIQTIRSQLAELKARSTSNYVAVLVGATSGIGESTAREITRYIPRPTIYLVGRAQAEADRIRAELQQLNDKSKVHFIKSDVSLLNQVDRVCAEIRAKEDKINLLCLSAGIMTTGGRDETTEGLDKKLSLHYYSRMRFAQNLLPALKAASAPSSALEDWQTARVISVLGAGYEASVNTADLALETSYSLRAAGNHAITMTSLHFDALAAQHPDIAFIHTSPGGVDTNLKRNLGPLTQYAWSAAAVLIRPFLTSVREAGERNAWTATCREFEQGGVHYIGQVNQPNGNPKFIAKLKADGTAAKVEQHTKAVFESVCKASTT